MEKELIKIDTPELSGIEKSKAEQIKNTFDPMVKMLEDFEESYNEIVAEALEGITKDITEKAKRVRIDIGKVRIQTEKLRKEQKEEYLRAGKAIDGVSNILKWAIAEKENKLKEIEDHFDRQEREKIEKIAEERTSLLVSFGVEIIPDKIGEMDIEIWDNFLGGVKHNYELRKQAEEKAENDRIELERKTKIFRDRKDLLIPFSMFGVIEKLSLETTEEDFNNILNHGKEEKERFDADRQEREAENNRLKKEKAIAEEKQKKEDDKRIAAEEKAEKEREAIQLKEKKDHDEALRLEREERQKVELELKRIEDKKIQDKKEAERKLQNDLNKSEAERKVELIKEIGLLKIKYHFKSDKFSFVNDSFDALINKLNITN